jgi:hypothetical protein
LLVKYSIVAEVLNSSPLNISFRRALVCGKLQEWHNLVLRLVNINLHEGKDIIIRPLHANGSFSIRPMYKYLISSWIRVTQEIWHTKLSLKIKIFMWYLKNGVILTKYNLVRRNWNGKLRCFCNMEESIKHLFFECAYARFLWRVVHIVFGIVPPLNTDNLFNNWIK